jgi:hypothetical protein
MTIAGNRIIAQIQHDELRGSVSLADSIEYFPECSEARVLKVAAIDNVPELERITSLNSPGRAHVGKSSAIVCGRRQSQIASKEKEQVFRVMKVVGPLTEWRRTVATKKRRSDVTLAGFDVRCVEKQRRHCSSRGTVI